MTSKIILKYAASISVSLLTAFVAWVALSSSYTSWYAGLEKSGLQPTDWFFGGIWLILLILMGIGAGIVWSKGFYHKWVQVALYHFGFQLLLIGFWFLLFFGLQEPLLALLSLAALMVLLLLTIKWFRIIDNTAAYLMYPSVIWIIYIAFLNFEVWRLN